MSTVAMSMLAPQCLFNPILVGELTCSSSPDLHLSNHHASFLLWCSAELYDCVSQAVFAYANNKPLHEYQVILCFTFAISLSPPWCNKSLTTTRWRWIPLSPGILPAVAGFNSQQIRWTNWCVIIQTYISSSIPGDILSNGWLEHTYIRRLCWLRLLSQWSSHYYNYRCANQTAAKFALWRVCLHLISLNHFSSLMTWNILPPSLDHPTDSLPVSWQQLLHL